VTQNLPITQVTVQPYPNNNHVINTVSKTKKELASQDSQSQGLGEPLTHH
jgi:hypothetical protein